MQLTFINYARRSSDEKSKKQVQSIDDQLKETRRVQREQGLYVLDEMTESRTAKEPGRPVFNAMMQKIERGEANAILCWKLDRLARNPIDAATFRWLMSRRKLLEIRTPYNVYRPEDNAVIAAVENAMAEQYIIDLKINVERGMKSKCEKGEFPLRVPSGYRNVIATRSVSIERQCFPLLRKAWDLLLSGDHTVPEIHDILINQWGYRNPPRLDSPDGKLSLSGLYQIFANPFYMGMFRFQGQMYHHKYRRMVTSQEWQLAQKMIKRRGRKRYARHAFPFTGLITCASCGFQATAGKAKGHTYYFCNNKLRICSKRGVREERIVSRISNLIDEITIPSVIEQFGSEVLSVLQSDDQVANSQISQVKDQTVDDINRQMKLLLDLHLRGHLSEEEYVTKKNELSSEQTDLSVDYVDAESNSSNREIQKALHFAGRARSLFMDDDMKNQRIVASRITESMFINNGDLQIELHPMLDPVRYLVKNEAQYFSSIEPLKNGSVNLKNMREEPLFRGWCSWIKEYRTLVRANNWSMPIFTHPDVTHYMPP